MDIVMEAPERLVTGQSDREVVETPASESRWSDYDLTKLYASRDNGSSVAKW